MSWRDHDYDHGTYAARKPRPVIRFTVKWCPACGARKDDDGGDRYCRATDACVTVRGALSSATTMQTVEVATREGWDRA